MTNIIPCLICFPFLAAILMFIIRNKKIRGILTYISVAAIIAMVAVLTYQFVTMGETDYLYYESVHTVNLVMQAAEVLLMLLVIVLCIKYKKYWIMLLSIIPTAMIIWVENFGPELAHGHHIRVDRLSLLMCIIVGVIGGMIVTYAVGYMKRYHEHHTEYQDRTSWFFALLFVFLGAMFGLVLSENLIWIFFFWEITSICSFLLIGYTRTAEAVNNSFRALWMNLLGGFGFAVGIVYTAVKFGDLSLDALVSKGDVAMIPVMLVAFAALTKSAQFPFSTWLLGAMVAPTPTSALLHSATMVKAGCYTLLRLAPALTHTTAGMFISIIGGITFLLASMLAISQSDGKKVLAYSTISNLGLIVTCAGVGSAGTVWAGVFLLIFHAVTKSMLFQCVGAVENSTHSRDVEDMSGLIKRLGKLCFLMVLGIIGMYLAPFGMLIFKWAALKAFIDSGVHNVFLVIIISFGSATTLFYWTKWLCKLLSYNGADKPVKDVTTPGQYVSLYFHGVLVVALCLTFSIISDEYVSPFIADVFGETAIFLSKSNLTLMIMLVLCLFLIPLLFYLFSRRMKRRTVDAYVSGINRQQGSAFYNSYGEEREMELSNWYLEDMFGEKKLLKFSVIVGAVFVVLALILVIGGAL
ncbi:MAG: NADH-quinone oxidoreductase subunit L [Lachnospiraceae bacterium]|nr:NADH-quinone oxidoreductase subunit L [Lachnospiraceae bacterium]